MDGQHVQTICQRPVPRAIRESSLMRQGGCAILDGLLGSVACAHLLDESRRCLHGAVATHVATSDDEEFRGGNPARRFISASGGDEQIALYHDPRIQRFLTGLCNAPVFPTGGGGTYTYYARPRDHLAIHRDIEACDVAVVTCLLDRHRAGSTGGVTRYYPRRQHERISRIRATEERGAVRVRVPVGCTMVMFGGLVPHEIEAIGRGEMRVVSILCFRAGVE